MKTLPTLVLLTITAIKITQPSAQAATIALVNSPTGNATFLTNFQAFIEARGDTFVRNPSDYVGVDVVFNIRQPVGAGLVDFVRGGGLMITEYTGIKNAGSGTGFGELLNYTDTGGGNAGSGTPVTFTAAGMALGLNSGLSNPYSDGGATEFFRNGIAVGDAVDVLATRALTGGGTTPAIVGAQAGGGYVLGLAFDWGDAFVSTPPTANTQQLITNALAVPVPEPSSSVMALLVGSAFWSLCCSRAARRYRPPSAA